MAATNDWTPTTDLLILRRMGKMMEEAGELVGVASRAIIQGIEEADPETGRTNRLRLEEEIADVYAQLDATVAALKLRPGFITVRRARKRDLMQQFESHLTPE